MEIREGLHLFLWNDPTQNNCNTYLLKGEKKILIDPGHFALFGNVISQLEVLRINWADMDMVISTHFHPDHMEAMTRFKGKRAIGSLFVLEYEFLKEMGTSYGNPIDEIPCQILLKEGRLLVGDIELLILHTPGHSPGHMCLYWPRHKALFSGDLLFQGGVGRTDLLGGDPEELKRSLKRLEDMDVEILLPGHGMPIMGRERFVQNLRMVKELFSMYL